MIKCINFNLNGKVLMLPWLASIIIFCSGSFKSANLVEFVQLWAEEEIVQPVSIKLGIDGSWIDAALQRVVPTIVLGSDLGMRDLLKLIMEGKSIFKEGKFAQVFVQALDCVLGQEMNKASVFQEKITELAEKTKVIEAKELFTGQELPKEVERLLKLIIDSYHPQKIKAGRAGLFLNAYQEADCWGDFFGFSFGNAFEQLLCGKIPAVTINCSAGNGRWFTLVLYKASNGDIGDVWLDFSSEVCFEDYKKAVSSACFKLINRISNTLGQVRKMGEYQVFMAKALERFFYKIRMNEALKYDSDSSEESEDQSESCPVRRISGLLI